MLRVNDNALSQRYAKNYIGIETSYFTKVLNSLEEKEWIIRELDTRDRRNRVIKANPKANIKLKKIYKEIETLNEKCQISLNEENLKQLHHSLNQISNDLKNHTD